MKIKIKGVSNGYIIEYDAEDRFGDKVVLTAVQNEDEELKKFIGSIIFKEYANRSYDGDREMEIEVN